MRDMTTSAIDVQCKTYPKPIDRGKASVAEEELSISIRIMMERASVFTVQAKIVQSSPHWVAAYFTDLMQKAKSELMGMLDPAAFEASRYQH